METWREDHRYPRGVSQLYFMYCLQNWGKSAADLSFKQSLWTVNEWYDPDRDLIFGGTWYLIKAAAVFDCHLLTCVYLSTGKRVRSPVAECRPGRREAEPLHQRQLRPRFQCLTELLCCDRYNLIHATLIPERMHAGAAVKDIHNQGGQCWET